MTKSDILAQAAARAGFVLNVQIVNNPPNSHGIDGKAYYARKYAEVVAIPQMSENVIAWAACHELGHLGYKSPGLTTSEKFAWERAEMIWFDTFGPNEPISAGMRTLTRNALATYDKRRK